MKQGYPRSIGLRQPEGFKEPVMFYEAWCPIHRKCFFDYKPGFEPRQRLDCPDCLEVKRLSLLDFKSHEIA